jgi:hypothetical protein
MAMALASSSAPSTVRQVTSSRWRSSPGSKSIAPADARMRTSAMAPSSAGLVVRIEMPLTAARSGHPIGASTQRR